MRKFLFFALLLFMGKLSATGDSLNYLTAKDTIFLSIGAFEEKFFPHTMEPKQTLYSLAQFYGLSVEELYYFNPGLKEQSIKAGMPIQVPIPNAAIKRYMESGFLPRENVPVYYVVKRGDTMYRIAKVYFRMPMELLMARNNLADHTLKEGQQLHVGWISVHGIPDSLRLHAGGPLARRNAALKKIFQFEAAGKRLQNGQGVAFWQKESKEDSDLYALHRSAPVNSIIEVLNPMTNRTVYVKVIGKIPETAYRNEVVVVLSPLAAKLLGAIDPRFFVKVRYYH
ncbi:MAG: LysM peptidoglycan-binding domain-containing protein [Phaeodactylibacter sp.]|nr:LysM peptidoglycan-binding domain-containing protein [Phaeodactylibacter sp.]MCB9265365.1 LysM peptidoglycan-binding domain-containing protein [Lewinellaceae bacterium]MCB9288587.1 LysM peptidoglycan-binding domain-containing protein [Lewinellaceae bacterium]